MVLVGVTDRAPDVWPPVAKLVLVHDVAFVEDHVSCDAFCPRIIELGVALKSAVGEAEIEVELLHA